MNGSGYQLSYRDDFKEAFVKNFLIVLLGLITCYINGTLVVIFIRNSIFHNDSRYILYINMVVNDMLMICISVIAHILSYVLPFINVSVCCVVLAIGSTTTRNTPLNLAVMAIERYIAICKPLHHPQICTVHRTHVLICLIWGVGVIPGVTDVIILIFTRPLSYFNSLIFCYAFNLYNTKYHREKIRAVQIIYMSAVWLTLIYTYIGVLLTAKKASTHSSVKKAQNTILLHGAQLLLCMMSYLMPVLDMILIPFFPAHRTKITFFSFLLTNIVPRLLSCLIYGVRDKKFVKYLRGYLCCKLIFVKVEPIIS